MDDKALPVEDSEVVYRRIPPSFVDVRLPLPIQAAAFRPNENDTTGLSVFRARFVARRTPWPPLPSQDAVIITSPASPSANFDGWV